MKTSLSLTKRNLIVFFRDIGAVSLSLIASLVLFVLYVPWKSLSIVSSPEKSDIPAPWHCNR